MLSGSSPQIEKAVRFVYLECLTREPSAGEMRDAKAVIDGAGNPLDGMSDLRWAILNCHEFRFLP